MNRPTERRAARKPGWDCSICNQRLEADAGWRFRHANDIVHCEGSLVALDDRARSKLVPHHGYTLHPNCWRCHQPMGCDQCAGVHPICRHCRVHTTPEGLAANGPVVRAAPLLESYPAACHAAWRTQLAADPAGLAEVYVSYRSELGADPSGAERRMGARIRATREGIGRPMPTVTAAEMADQYEPGWAG